LAKLALVLALVAQLGAATPSESPSRPDPRAVFDAATALVKGNFYDKTLRGLPWDHLTAEARASLRPNSGDDELKVAVNGLLSRLQASHTEFYSDRDQAYWALRGIFSHRLKGHPVRQVGAWFERSGDKWFVRNVFEGSEAAAAGILPGDEVVSADGEPLQPVVSFRTLKAALGVRLEIRRSPTALPRSIHVETAFRSYQEIMLLATKRSARIYSRGGRKVGYFHLWAGTHREFLRALKHAAHAYEKQADALVLDLRDGFGGAGPEYVEPFERMSDGDSPLPEKHRFGKPLVVLVNGGTRSGKEWVAYLLKKAGRTLVGTTTRGYFLAARPYVLGEARYLLYLAVSNAGPPGVEIEGKGVIPDVEVPFDFHYSAGADPQLERALAVAAEQAKARLTRLLPQR
jgi:carboxyl-terminal processing protease